MNTDAQQVRERARHQAIEKTVVEVDRVLLDNTDGNPEMLVRLTAEVALSLFHQAVQPLRVDSHSMVEDGLVYTVVCRAKQVLHEECPESSKAVLNSMLFRVAQKFIDKVGISFNTALIKHDLEHPARAE